ncbi:NmrA family NAD(P)-binding protein [Streptomyces sp. NPDC002888]|uniref:NmrA family NAD(P)-binding protein n=1 Tax=Streptomyces sp. NPDC002888 TaxID=3364668 RepID=UPI0036A437F6
MITITAATGHYGRLVVDELLKRGVPASGIVAAVRDPAKAADLAERGVQVREADYDRPETLVPAFAGTTTLLLVPGAVFGQRHPQIQRAIAAAVEARVGMVAYASFVNTGTSTLRLGEEHKQTEQELRSSGLPHVLLRNGAYVEMYTTTLGPALEHGAIIGSFGDGKISGATRADLAAAAAVVLLAGDDQAGKVYELGGTAFTMSDLAAEVSRQTGKPVTYQDMPVDQYAKALTGAGLPAGFADLLADTSLAATRGDWYTDSTDLPQLIGRPSTTLAAAVADALKAGPTKTFDPRG